MQTTSTLPIQVTGAGAANAPQRNSGNAEASQFSATLSREMDQRRQLPPTAAQQPARPQQPAKSQQADKPAAKQAETNKAAAQDEAKADDSAVAKADAATDEESTDTAQAGADQPSNPVADMLALVASFNQSMRKAAPADAVPAEARAASADAGQLTALQAATRRFADVADSGKPAVEAEQLDAAAARATLADALGTGQPKAQDSAGSFAPALDAASKRAASGLDAGQLRDAALKIEEIKAPAPQAQFAVQAQAAAALEAAHGANPAGEHIPARVGTPGWDNQVGQKIVWMVAGGDQSAELTLNPPDLGPMQVVLNVSGDQASVTFSSNQMEVRQALENALPRLREMMSESGIALGNATVNSGSDQRQAQDGQGGGANGGGARFAGNGDASGTEAARPAARTTVLGDRGMVDTFA